MHSMKTHSLIDVQFYLKSCCRLKTVIVNKVSMEMSGSAVCWRSVAQLIESRSTLEDCVFAFLFRGLYR